MLLAELTLRRKLALGIALPWFLFTSLFVVYTLHSGAGLPFMHWRFAASAAWLVASAGASGLVTTELLRLTARSGATWSDRRHFWIALIISLALLAVQSLSFGFAHHATGARAF